MLRNFSNVVFLIRKNRSVLNDDYLLRIQKILKEIAQIDADVARLEIRLQDEAFLSKAPAPVVAKEKERLVERKERAARLRQQIG